MFPETRPAINNVHAKLEALLIVILLLYWGKYLFMPLSLAAFVAIFLQPLARLFEKIHVPRVLSAALPVVLLMVFLTAFIYFFKSQLVNILKDLPALKEKLKSGLEISQSWIERNYKIDVAVQTNFLKKQLNSIIDPDNNGITSLLKFVILPALFLFFTFYILLYRKLLLGFLLSLSTRKDHSKVQEISASLQHTVNNYIKGLIIEMTVLAALSYIVLLILGIKYAILMAIFAALLNIFPYIGIYIAALINMLIAMTTGELHEGIEVVIVFIVIHVIDANLLMPFIVGNRIK